MWLLAAKLGFMRLLKKAYLWGMSRMIVRCVDHHYRWMTVIRPTMSWQSTAAIRIDSEKFFRRFTVHLSGFAGFGRAYG